MPLSLQNVLHPLMVPLQLLAMLGLGLLIDQQAKSVRLRSLPVAVATFFARLILGIRVITGSLLLVFLPR